MFREIRRKDKVLEEELMLELLKNAEYGVLSTVGDDGYPYGVPLNYVYKDNSIYFHCALEGHKLDNINFNHKASFCVVSDVKLLPSKFNTEFKSVICFGQIKEVAESEKHDIFMAIIEKFSKDFIPEGKAYATASGSKAKIYKLEIQHMTGKAHK